MKQLKNAIQFADATAKETVWWVKEVLFGAVLVVFILPFKLVEHTFKKEKK